MNITEIMAKRSSLLVEREAIEKEINSLSSESTPEVIAMREALNAKYATNLNMYEALSQQMEGEREVAPSKGQAFREVVSNAVKNGVKREITLADFSSAAHPAPNLGAAGAQNTTIHDLLPLLEKGLIFDKVGLKIQNGITGKLLWPYATTNVEVIERAEKSAVDATDINFDKVEAQPKESSLVIKVTNEAIDESSFDLMSFVQSQLTVGVTRYLNKKMFANAYWTGLKSPFSKATNNATITAINGDYKTIKAKKALIAATGVDMSKFAYVTNAKTAAYLETMPKANGQGGFIMADGKIDGDPVFITEDIAYTGAGYDANNMYLEMGCFNYLAANQHGEVRITVDPITLAAENETRFILHTRWSLTDLSVGNAFASYKLTEVTPTQTVAVDGVVKTKEQD